MKRRIVDMANNIEETIAGHLKSCYYFSLQVDESTDVSDNANLMCFVRYDLGNTYTSHEELLFCKSLPTRTTAEELFNLINRYIIENGIEWNKCVGLSSDGARAMSGIRTGLFPRVKAVAPECVWVHCSIHREALAVKKMPLSLTETMQECVKFINFIKSRPLNSRIFSALCKEMGSDHEHLLLHCEVRWLSRGNVLKRLIELKEEVSVFLEQNPPTSKDAIFEFKDRFHDANWLVKVAYICDVFDFLNNLNLALQGENVTIFKVQEKVEAATKKLNLWSRRIKTGNYEAFTMLTAFQKENNISFMPHDISALIQEHLQGLEANLKEYFPPINSNKEWIRNPFSINIKTTFSDLNVESLIELSCDTALKDIYKKRPLIDFWLSCRQEYPVVAEQAIKFLMPFVTTYKCEAGFSTLVFLKNKYRNRLEVEPDLRIKLTSFPANLEFLVKNKQLHTSH